ncbi:MAG: primosomal protein N' [Phycisphaerae bacterium]|nr:primosomal protein N' [Phycisphaerae bacterium]
MAKHRTDRATPSLIDPPELRTAGVATVALLRPLDKPYSYRIPAEIESAVSPGVRVTVPFGRNDRPTTAFCLSVSEQPWDSTLKPILSAVDASPLLNDKLLELGRWIARYYAAPLGRTLDLMVPAAAKRHAGWKKVRYATLVADGPQESRGPQPERPSNHQAGDKPAAEDLSARGKRENAGSETPFQTVETTGETPVPQFCHGLLSQHCGTGVPPVPSPPRRRCQKDGGAAGDRGIGAKQAAVLAALRDAGGTCKVDECAKAAGCGPGVIRTLQASGFITIETRDEPIPPGDSGVDRHEPDFELNADQRAAIDQLATEIAARRFSVQVLYGVTGSGKTECYVAAMRRAIADGRQAILLVPEIALTTQTVRRLQARFDRVATVHSGLTGVERSRTWAAIASGDISVVIGTRSAVFAPCADLGVIIVDEEAESSYKNLAAPRYHTRDIAIKRGHLEDIPVVLGSATPSLETWKNVQQREHYHLLRLPHRVRGLAMPTMHLVDMRVEHKARRGVHLLSRAMEWHLERVLDRGEQAVLLLNRRGYANFLHCPRCQTVVTCPHCSVHMVFHATTGLAHCHYCHARLAVPNKCQMAGCGGNLVRFGIGTQRVEAEIREKFPAARLRRVDSDVMQRAADYADVLGAFERKEFDILVGTQMIAKGLDFPFVSFVGVVSADTALALDDFRSEERTFQLVLQVAGRSGRGDVGGHVVVQTFAADTAPIRHAVAGDYEGFAKTELANRRRAKLPPYTRMVRIVLSDPRMTRLRDAAAKLARAIQDALRKRGIQATVFGPHPAAIARLKDMYRYDILLVFPAPADLLSAIDLFKSEGTLKTGARSLTVDVDPVSLQ